MGVSPGSLMKFASQGPHNRKSFSKSRTRTRRTYKNEKSPPDLSVKQGQIGGWEFAMLSFPCWH